MALIEHFYPLFAALSILFELQCFELVCALCMSYIHLCIYACHIMYILYAQCMVRVSQANLWMPLLGKEALLLGSLPGS